MSRPFSDVVQKNSLKLGLSASAAFVVVFLALALSEWKPDSPWASIIAGLPIGLLVVLLLKEDAIDGYVRGYLFTCVALLASAFFGYFAILSVDAKKGGVKWKRAVIVMAIFIWGGLNYWRAQPFVRDRISC